MLGFLPELSTVIVSLLYVAAYVAFVWAVAEVLDTATGKIGQKKGTSKREKLLLKNPFQADDYMSPIDWFKFIGFGIVLIPLRILAMTLLTLVTAPLMLLSAVGVDTSKPLPKSRATVQLLIGNFVGYAVAAIMGVKVNVVGRYASTNECKMLIIGPHSTLYDSFCMGVGTAGTLTSTVGKASIVKSKLGKALADASQGIFVDRANKKSAARTADIINERVRLDGPWHRRVVMFPEGSTTNATALLRFRMGAFQPGVPVQPLVMRWRDELTFTTGSKNRNLLALRAIAQPYHEVTLEFLPVYHPTEEEKAHPMRYADHMQQIFAKELGVPTTNFSIKDRMLAQLMVDKKVSPAKIMPFSIADVSEELQDQKIDLSGEEIYQATVKLLKIFIKVAGGKSDRLTERQYEKAADMARKEFNTPDQHHVEFEKKTMAFRKFLMLQFLAINEADNPTI